MNEENVRKFCEHITSLPTIGGGQTANLKINDENFRVWDDRVDGTVSIECLISGYWVTIMRLS